MRKPRHSVALPSLAFPENLPLHTARALPTVALAATQTDQMGRPKKSSVASRANGGCATNKGKIVNGKEELFGAYSADGTYIVRKTLVRRKFMKGEVKPMDSGCERDVFTFCLYHGEFKSVNDASVPSSEAETYGKGGASIAGWKAARRKAATMIEECAALSARAKVAKLRKFVKGADVRIKFQC